MKHLYNNRGYTLLFAALTAALVLGVAVFILSVSRKQYILASTARDSIFSIYAADSGIECVALRNANLEGNYTGIGTVTRISSSTIQAGFQLNCNGENYSIEPIAVTTHPSYEGGTYVQAQGYIATGGTSCAQITASSGVDGEGRRKKVYDSRGYNLCKFDGGGRLIEPNFDSPRTVERALRLTFNGVW